MWPGFFPRGRKPHSAQRKDGAKKCFCSHSVTWSVLWLSPRGIYISHSWEKKSGFFGWKEKFIHSFLAEPHPSCRSISSSRGKKATESLSGLLPFSKTPPPPFWPAFAKQALKQKQRRSSFPIPSYLHIIPFYPYPMLCFPLSARNSICFRNDIFSSFPSPDFEKYIKCRIVSKVSSAGWFLRPPGCKVSRSTKVTRSWVLSLSWLLCLERERERFKLAGVCALSRHVKKKPPSLCTHTHTHTHTMYIIYSATAAGKVGEQLAGGGTEIRYRGGEGRRGKLAS